MNVAYNVDCMEYMRTLQDKAFDLAVVDPPYFSGPERRGYYGCKISPIGVHREYPISPKWDIPCADYFSQLVRVAKKYIVWGCTYFDYHFAPGRIVWDKCNDGADQSGAEIAFNSLNLRTDIFRFMWRGMMQGKSIAEGTVQQGNKSLNEKRIHPTQKPVALYTWILQKYAKPGDKILDTHLGSGSSRIAAYDLGFDFVGCEIDPHYFQAQERRFAEHTAQISLFTGG